VEGLFEANDGQKQGKEKTEQGRGGGVVCGGRRFPRTYRGERRDPKCKRMEARVISGRGKVKEGGKYNKGEGRGLSKSQIR